MGDFMTKKEALYVVKPTTSVDEGISITFASVLQFYDQFTGPLLTFTDAALETLVEKRITGFPVVDDDWHLVIPIFNSFLK